MAKSILSNNPGQLVTKAKVNVSDWTSYTPTFQGFGTVTNINVRWRRVGDNLEVEGYFSTGTGTGVEARMGFPSGLVSASTLPTLSLAGKVIWNDATNPASYFHGLIEPNVSYFTFGGKQTSQSQLIKVDGNSYTTSPHNLSVKFSVPIEGWSSQAEFLAPQIQPKVAFIKDVKPSGTAGGTFTAGAWQTRTLNTVSGDSEIVSLSSNQFTLQPGKYLIEAIVPAYKVNVHKAKLVSDPSGTPLDEIIGSNEQIDSAVNIISQSKIIGTLTVSESKVFEIQHRCSTTGTTTGFGNASSFGVDEIYTIVKITKIL